MTENSIRSEIAQLGKFTFIEKVTEKIKIENSSTKVGIGDDATVIQSDDNLVVTASKIFTENIHFDLTYFPLKHLGYKCAAIAMSDIIAMNAIPSQLIINLAVSNRFSVEAIEELMTGFRACCHFYKVDISGFDVTSSISGLT